MPISVLGTPLSFADATGGDVVDAYTVANGDDKLLVVCEQVGSVNSTGVTYGGEALTLAVQRDQGGHEAKIWYLIDPPEGTTNIVISYDGGSVQIKIGGAITAGGVDQSSPIGATNTAAGSGTVASVVVTTTEDDSVVVDSLRAAGSVAQQPTPGADQTEFENEQRGGASYEPAGTAPDSITMSWSLPQSNTWALVAAEIIAAQGGTPVSKDTTASFEALTGIAKDRAVTNEAEGADVVTRINATPVEALAIIQRGVAPALESLAPVLRDRAAPVGALTTLAPAALVTLEALTELLRQHTAPSESLKILVRERSAATEALAGVSRSVFVPLDAESAALVREVTFPLESVANLRRGFTVPIESLLPLARLRLAPAEAQALLRRDRIAPLELVSAFVAVSRSAAVPLEALVAVARELVVPAETLATLVRDRAVPYEVAGQSLTRAVAVALESLAAVLRALGVPYEAISTIVIVPPLTIALIPTAQPLTIEPVSTVQPLTIEPVGTAAALTIDFMEG